MFHGILNRGKIVRVNMAVISANPGLGSGTFADIYSSIGRIIMPGFQISSETTKEELLF
jgi:hypothetical protein